MHKKNKKIVLLKLEKKIKNFLFFYFFPIWILFIFSIFLLNSDFFKIKKIQVNIKNNNIFVKKENIMQEIEKKLLEKYFGIYSKNNFIFFPKKKILENIKKNNLEIKKIIFFINKWNKEILIEIEEEKN